MLIFLVDIFFFVKLPTIIVEQIKTNKQES
jgi:hypothetical protein